MMKKFIVIYLILHIFALRLTNDEDLQNPLNAEMNEKELAKSQENLKNLEAQLKALESKKDSFEKDIKSIKNDDIDKQLSELEDKKPKSAHLTRNKIAYENEQLQSEITEQKEQDPQSDHNLIQILKNKNIFPNLPVEVRNLLKSYESSFGWNSTKFQKMDPVFFFESNNITQSPVSQPIIDPLGKIGRRGFLTLVNTTSLESKSVWTVLNSKVFCLYDAEDTLSITRLIRNSIFRYEDILATPCLTVYADQNEQDKTMLCTPSIGEKEIWIQYFNQVIQNYKI